MTMKKAPSSRGLRVDQVGQGEDKDKYVDATDWSIVNEQVASYYRHRIDDEASKRTSP